MCYLEGLLNGLRIERVEHRLDVFAFHEGLKLDVQDSVCKRHGACRKSLIKPKMKTVKRRCKYITVHLKWSHRNLQIRHSVSI